MMMMMMMNSFIATDFLKGRRIVISRSCGTVPCSRKSSDQGRLPPTDGMFYLFEAIKGLTSPNRHSQVIFYDLITGSRQRLSKKATGVSLRGSVGGD